jgi:hypothetical protein
MFAICLGNDSALVPILINYLSFLVYQNINYSRYFHCFDSLVEPVVSDRDSLKEQPKTNNTGGPIIITGC